MHGRTTNGPNREGRLARRLAAAVLILAWPALLTAPVAAHEGEEEIPAAELVEQAIALIRGQPDQIEAIADKIHDALEAEDADGVDLELVEQADAAFEAGDLHEAQDLLERAIGAAPHEVVVSPNDEPGEPAPSPEVAEPPPVLHETSLGRGEQDIRGGPILIGVAVLLAGLGFAIVRRYR